MGPQQVLRATALLLVVGGVAYADRAGWSAPKSPSRERIAVIDLGPDDGTRQKLAAAIVGGGFEAVIGDGVEDALAGINADRDTVTLAAALVEAKDKFGALACP